MNLLITGDFFVSDDHRGETLIDDSVVNLFKTVDFRTVNLEAPVTCGNPEKRIIKTGPHLQSAPETTIPLLMKLNIDLATLANNHIMDYGEKGITATLYSLKSNGIGCVGGGLNLTEASAPYTLEKDGLKLAILNFTENEWSIAEKNKPGANPLDIIENIRQIKLARSDHNKVIVIIHGGHEYYHLPSPRMIKQYRFYAENGADAIVCHHTHCIGGYEVYNNVPIFYSLGNFLFTIPSKRDTWYTGTILKLIINPDQAIGFKLYPTRQHKQKFTVNLLSGSEKVLVEKNITNYCSIISNEVLLLEHWNSYLSQESKQYIKCFSPANVISNRYIRAALNRIILKHPKLLSRYFKMVLNIFRCEAHADIAKETLKYLLLENGGSR